MKMAFVLWEDAADLDQYPWAEHEETFVYKPVLVEQIGYVLYDGEEGVVLTSSVFVDDSTVGCRTQIPRGMIRSITIIDDND
jgi:hypothetical protein